MLKWNSDHEKLNISWDNVFVHGVGVFGVGDWGLSQGPYNFKHHTQTHPIPHDNNPITV